MWHVPSSSTSLFPVIEVSTHGPCPSEVGVADNVDVGFSDGDFSDGDSDGACVGIGIPAIVSSAKSCWSNN